MPPYATAAGGAETEVEVATSKKPRGRLTAPEDPERAVSSEEFSEMVRDLHDDGEVTVTEEEPPEAPAASSGLDALPEDLVLKDEPAKPKESRRKRNKKHGRR